MKIVELTTRDEALSVAPMLAEYIAFVCADLKRHTDISFDPEILTRNSLADIDKVVPPLGRTFVAQSEVGARIGMVFLRPSGPDAVEIKRLYVSPDARGTGAGRALVDAVLAAARETGVSVIRLDTTRNLTSAIALYEKLGFRLIDPYPESDHFDDTHLHPHMVFMELDLRGER